MAHNYPKWPKNEQELCEPISLSLERALSSEIGSQDPCSARSAAPALQHFMLLCDNLVLLGPGPCLYDCDHGCCGQVRKARYLSRSDFLIVPFRQFSFLSTIESDQKRLLVVDRSYVYILLVQSCTFTGVATLRLKRSEVFWRIHRIWCDQ